MFLPQFLLNPPHHLQPNFFFFSAFRVSNLELGFLSFWPVFSTHCFLLCLDSGSKEMVSLIFSIW